MKASIVRITRHIITDLDHYTIYHMCFWTVFYSSGTVRTVKGYSVDSLSGSQQKFMLRKPLRYVSKPIPYCESGFEVCTSFY